MILALLQQAPHLAQIGAHRRLQRRIAFDQGRADAEGDASEPILVCSTVGLLMAGLLVAFNVWLLRPLLDQFSAD